MASSGDSPDTSNVWAMADKNTGPGEQNNPYDPPRLTVNLSLAPERRYDQVTAYMKQRLDLRQEFNDILDETVGPSIAAALRITAHLLMRRLHSDEEDAELRGISKATGIPHSILVMINVFLDMVMGCTSGGARVSIPADKEAHGSSGCLEGTPAGDGDRGAASMLHFRTLDWCDGPLRKMIVELDFVASEGGPVVARTLTYYGYVGVLTGVRPGLSVSLNSRVLHDRSTLRKRFRYRGHQLLACIGRRPGISSQLRSLLFDNESLGAETATPPKGGDSEADSPKRIHDSGEKDADISNILQKLQAAPSTAAYLVLCTPTRVYSIEQDHRSATWTSSDNFLVACNHDVAEEASPRNDPEAGQPKQETRSFLNVLPGFPHRIGWIIDQSMERKKSIMAVREGIMDARRRKNAGEHDQQDRHSHCRCGDGEDEQDKTMTHEDLLTMVKTGPISNEGTHFAVVMDPSAGEIVWQKAYAEN